VHGNKSIMLKEDEKEGVEEENGEQLKGKKI
jgi:hypothetical protein